MAQPNIVALNQGTVYEDIMIFLKGKGIKSTGTSETYESAIRYFYKYMKNKDIENLTVDDLQFKNRDMVRYQTDLNEQYANSTVNKMVSAVVSLYEFLEKNEYPVKVQKMRVDFLPDTSEQYGELTVDEAVKMSELVLNQYKGEEKSELIKMAFRTSFRKGALLSLTWDDIKWDEQQGLYLVHVIDKRQKKCVQPLRKDQYEELLKIKECKYYQKYNDNLVFHITEKTISEMMQKLVEEMSIPESRKIVFHSLRKCAPNWLVDTQDSVIAAQQQLNHSNMNTTYKNYISKKKDYHNAASVTMEEQIDDTICDDMTREELLELVKMQKNGTWMQLKRDAKQIVDAR